MKNIVIAIFIATLSITATASQKQFEDELKVRYPATVGASIKPSFPGFYSVSKGQEVFFVKEDFTILINGDVRDLTKNRSITNELQQESRKQIIGELNTADAIKFGEGKKRLFVFSDPDCVYCKKLQLELQRLTDTEIFLFPFPLSMHPDAANIAESIWCSSNKAATWNGYMLEKVQPKVAKCANPVKRNISLAEKYQISGTPAIIYPDGSITPGYVPATTIASKLASIYKAAK